MVAFRKIWRAFLFFFFRKIWRFKIRPFALLPTNCTLFFLIFNYFARKWSNF